MKLALLTTDNREHCREYHLKDPYFGTAPEALLQGMAGMSELEVHVVTCTQRPLTSPSHLAQNIFFYSLHVPKSGWMRTGYQGCIRAVRKKLKEIRPDIVHGQGTERDCAISAVFSGFPNVLTIHGNMAALARMFRAPLGSFHWLAGKLEDFTLPRSDGVLCNSAYTEELVKQRGCRTWRVPNPLRAAFFESIPAQGGQSFRLLNVGVISERKRQLELLNLARRLRTRELPVELIFVGKIPSDSYGKRFLVEMEKEKHAGWASYVGVLSTEQLIEQMDSASGLVHFPSEEAFGLVVAEGLARGLKFFGSSVGGIVEIAKDVPSAELFGVEDWDGLETALEHWFKSVPVRNIGGARLIKQRYSPEIIASRHVEIYREVLRTAS